MKIANSSNNSVLSTDLKYAVSFGDNLFGLFKKSNPRSLLFKTRFGIHTFFLKNPIDVIVLDDKFKIVKLKTVLPNRLFFWNPKFNMVIELPPETIKKSNTKIGDLLNFSNKKAS